MSADLHIHVLEGVTEEDLRNFNSHNLSSKHYGKGDRKDSIELYEKFSDSPNVWVGEVSWLKAMVLGPTEEFVPDTVGAVYDIIGEDLPVVDAALIDRIAAAMRLKNATGYRVTTRDQVVSFLSSHVGKKVFTISW